MFRLAVLSSLVHSLPLSIVDKLATSYQQHTTDVTNILTQSSMPPRQSKRLAGHKLANNFNDVIFSGKREGLLDLRTKRERKYAKTPVRLTFFDILPELRIRVYKYAMETDQPRNLQNLKTPTLAAVSKQVRAECLPVFFSECTFTDVIISNYIDVAELDGLAARGALPPTYDNGGHDVHYNRQRAGRWLYGRPKMRLLRVLKGEGVTPAFRNVVIRALCPGSTGQSDLWLRAPVASKSRPAISFNGSGKGAEELQGLEVLRRQVEAAAVQVASSRERFVGFTFQDLQGVVGAFAYWPDGDS